MQISITFKKLDPSDSLKSYVHKRLKKLDKMLDKPADVHVVLSVEKIRHSAEISFDCDRLKVHAREESETMYAAIDAMADKIKSQIKKSKEKQRRHLAGDRQSIKAADTVFEVPDNFSSDSLAV